jgi:hypothetical protein
MLCPCGSPAPALRVAKVHYGNCWIAPGALSREARRALDGVGARDTPGHSTHSPAHDAEHRHYGRASRIMLNGVSVALRTSANPPSRIADDRRENPACAPSAAPTGWSSEVGTQIIVEAA